MDDKAVVYWPYTFDNADELIGKAVKHKTTGVVELIVTVTKCAVMIGSGWGIGYNELLSDYNFLSGGPCGVKVGHSIEGGLPDELETTKKEEEEFAVPREFLPGETFFYTDEYCSAALNVVLGKGICDCSKCFFRSFANCEAYKYRCSSKWRADKKDIYYV